MGGAVVNRQDLQRPSMTLGDFIVDNHAVLRCTQCAISPGQTEARRVGWCETPFSLLQFALAARDHVRDHHPDMRWAP